MKDEVLLLSQAAYLFKMPKYAFENLLTPGPIPYIVRRNRRLIKSSDLKKYVDRQRAKQENFRSYMKFKRKIWFWKRTEKTFQNAGKYHDESGIEYLTIGQVAYLLGIARPGAHRLANKCIIPAVNVKVSGAKNPVTYIRADDLEHYVETLEARWNLAMEYFSCEDTEKFWSDHEADYQEKWILAERERFRKSRYGKKKKVQKETCGADQRG